MSKIEELKTLAEDITVLYVEDNKGMRDNMQRLFQSFFNNIFVAVDGIEGYQLFTQKKPPLVITDIIMPNMNGFQMIKKIKSEDPDTEIIYITAHNDKEHLQQAIDAGVFRYLSKPANVAQLIDVLYDAIKVIHYRESKHLFENQLKDIFNYQNNLLIMFKNTHPVIVNQRVLGFFGIASLEDFLQNYPSLDHILREHQGFLYSTDESTWFQTASENSGKLYHAKMINHKDENRHMIMKLREIPEKKGSVIVSFDDVTELNLMSLYDQDEAIRDKAFQEKSTVLKFMKIVDENKAKIKLHNFYKGLTITNPAVFVALDDGQVVIKTTHPQLKIIKLVKNITISSEVFPSDVFCKSIKKIDFDTQTISLNDMQFIQHSCNDRQYIRLEPEENHNVSFFFEGKKLFGEVKIIDISIVSVKLEVNTLPPGISINQEISIVIVLPTSGAPLNINTPAKILRIDEYKRTFHIIAKFELTGMANKHLLDYLAQRQMALIREFKSLEID